jgi:galactose mutarotase-like enzyme
LVEVLYQVLNAGDQVLPLSPGLRPYWAVNHADKRRIRIEGIEGFDATKKDSDSGGSMWDVKPPDDAYSYNGKIVIHLPGVQITLEDITGNGPVIRNVAVWSQTPQKADYNFVCVEPVCGLDDAIHDSPISVPSGQAFDMKIRVQASFK